MNSTPTVLETKNRGRKGRKVTTTIAALGVIYMTAPSGVAQTTPGDRPIAPLTGKTPLGPSPADYNAIVKNPATLIALGKALFWDTQVASANDQACASCHFHAGADIRTINQLDPGLRRQPDPDNSFGGVFNPAGGFSNPLGSGNLSMGSGGQAGPNIALAPDDFPFHKLSPVPQPDGTLAATDREAAVLFDTNDIASSQGAFQGGPATQEGNAVGQRTRCDPTPGAPFAIMVGGTALNTRKVEPRNTPTTINAVFNHRNFWDGRANNTFNGVSPFGRRDSAARVFRNDGSSQILLLDNMSTASQAVGPVTNSTEMTCQGKIFADVGRRLMQQRPLANQQVAADDSVFSKLGITSPSGGLKSDYRKLVQQAFQPAYWSNNQHFVLNPDGTITKGGGAANGYQIDELNFSMFLGLAIDAYERTLISDQTPFDAGLPAGSAAERGQEIFTGKGDCVACHDGPLFSKATAFQGSNPFQPIEHMPMNNGAPSFYDHGFYNTGARPAFEDVGVGGLDPFGNPLSFTRQLLESPSSGGVSNIGIDQFQVFPCQFEIVFSANCNQLPNASEAPQQRVDIDAAFKTPGLRNVALTPPYMHNGGQKSLAEVVAFYNRGGDRRAVSSSGPTDNDTTGTGPLGRPLGISPDGTTNATPRMGGSNVHRDIKPLGLSAQEQSDLVEFMKALTDHRVACHAAPFDHPSLTVANGQLAQSAIGNADDRLMTIPAVGAAGYPKCSPALQDQMNAGDLFVASPAFRTMTAP
jgi:cytochrome c peroxidase